MLKWLMAFVLFLIQSAPARGQTTEPSPSEVTAQNVMSEQEAVALRNELRALAQAMDIEVPASTTSGQASAQTEETKTMADVADRALTMVDGVVAQLSKTIQNVAPELWRIMIKQQYAKAATEIIRPGGVFLVALVYWLLARKMVPPMADRVAEYAPRGDEIFPHLFGFVVSSAAPVAVMVFAGVNTVYNFAYSVAYLINPEYYAVRDIMLMLLNPAAMQ